MRPSGRLFLSCGSATAPPLRGSREERVFNAGCLVPSPASSRGRPWWFTSRRPPAPGLKTAAGSSLVGAREVEAVLRLRCRAGLSSPGSFPARRAPRSASQPGPRPPRGAPPPAREAIALLSASCAARLPGRAPMVISMYRGRYPRHPPTTRSPGGRASALAMTLPFGAPLSPSVSGTRRRNGPRLGREREKAASASHSGHGARPDCRQNAQPRSARRRASSPGRMDCH